MAAVAEGLVFGVFATAPGDGFGSVDLGLDGGEVGAFVGSVTEGLSGGPATGAPPIGAWLGL